MRQPSEDDPTLGVIDAALQDLSLRSARYVGRRRDEGDARTFIIQTGEEGRHRLKLPDRNSDASLEAVVADTQAHLENVLGAPVPLCPRHGHALLARATNGTLTWVCPAGEWLCALGDYEELTWPQLHITSLAPILARRLHGGARSRPSERSLSQRKTVDWSPTSA